jgi:hypothetical protein
MFGERLASLPSAYRQDFGDIVLVQPYDSPQQWTTSEAQARERELIQLLGPDCFYDRERRLMPSRVPSV